MSVLNCGLFVIKYYFGLFCIFGRQVVSSVLKCGPFQNFWLSLDTCGLFQLARRDIPHNALTFYLLSEDQISECNILCLSSLNLTDKPYNGDSHKILGLIYVKYLLPKCGLILKTVATFVQNVGLIW